MKTTKTILAAAMLFAIVSCANEDISKEKESDRQEDKVLTAFVSGDEVNTRTSMDHEIGGKGKFFWETGDNIFVTDDSGSPIASTSSTITGKTSHARFQVSGSFNNATTYPVTYTGKNSTSADEVTIATNQTQSTPNSTAHLGESGDCGTAMAMKDANGIYNFKLKHRAAYLCFQPRTTDVYVKRSKLIRIEIKADNEIAGTYTLSPTGLTLKSGGSKAITLTTGSGFEIDNATANLDKNGSYAVIAPGQHTLMISYWLHCADDGGGGQIDGTLTKIVQGNFKSGEVYDITANLQVPVYPSNSYYMWDATEGQHYWKGYEWDSSNPQQPTIIGHQNSNYPKVNTDPRWYNEAATYPTPASHTAANCPNYNECIWYCVHGDPHWDYSELWASMGHLYNTGAWFKKQSRIATDNGKTVQQLKEHAPDGHDYTTEYAYRAFTNNSLIYGKPDVSDLSDYFYLPGLGQYWNKGMLYGIGAGNYWSRTPYLYNKDYAYYLMFNGSWVEANGTDRTDGCTVWTADDSDNQYQPFGM